MLNPSLPIRAASHTFSHLLISVRCSASKKAAPTIVRRQEKTVLETPVTSGPSPSSGAKDGVQLLSRGWLSSNFRMNRGIRCLFGDIFAWFAAVLRNYPDMSNPFRVEWIADCFPCRTASPVIKPVLMRDRLAGPKKPKRIRIRPCLLVTIAVKQPLVLRKEWSEVSSARQPITRQTRYISGNYVALR